MGRAKKIQVFVMSNKYGAVKVKLDGYVFDSKREAFRYQQLCFLVNSGDISNLRVHPVYPLIVNNLLICKYEADFYYTENSKEVVEDVKGVKTDVYKLKKKLMLAVYGIKILETS
jgi:Protein of unknown function (DUF1064)